MGSETSADPATRDVARRAIFDSAVDLAIIATDTGGQVTAWNAGAEQVFGWPAADMMGSTLHRLFAAGDLDADRPAAHMRQALQDGRAVEERWHVRRDGSRFRADGETVALRDARGGHVGFLAILHDRTEVQRAQERQRADAEFIDRVMAASGDCIKVVDLEGRLLFMSESGQQLMEVTDLQALLGCAWQEFWQGDSHVAASQALEVARSGGKARFEGSADTQAGNARRWDVQVTPILGSDGRPQTLLVVSRDITEARRASAEIARLAGLVEQSTDFIGIADPDGRMLFVNPAGRRLVGLSDDTPAPRAILDFFTPDAGRKMAEQVLPAVQRVGYWEGELDLRHAGSGAAIPVSHTIFSLRDTSGAVTGYGTLTRDLRALRRADARRSALLELGDRMRDLGDPVRMAYAAAAVMGQALGVDRAGYGTLGPDGETLVIERDWTASGHHSIAGIHRMGSYRSYLEVLRRGETVAVSDMRDDARSVQDRTALDAIGVRAMIDLPVMEQGRLVALFFIHSGEPRVWHDEELGFVRDAAERTRDAIERRRAEMRLQALAGALEQQMAERTRERDRIWQVSQDLLGVADLDGRWLSINPAWQAVLGWSETEILGLTSEGLVHPDELAAARAQLALLATGQRRLAFEHRCRTRDGRYRWLSWTAVVEQDRIYCVARDVTAEKAADEALRQAEDRLRQSQKMEAVGQLTGGLAHDFNNLLTGITGSLELLGTRIGQGRLADTGRYIQAAQDAVQRASALTQRLLAFSRRQTLEPRAVDVNRLVSGMEELVRRTVGPAIAVEFVAEPALWTALVDPNQLENALLNLCINARDAMPDGGRITIETTNLWLDQGVTHEPALPAGHYLTLRVVDTGTGMTPDVLGSAFDPFFTTKPSGKGTGLGLSMIEGFARQSGGMVQVESEVGRGTTMCLILPRHQGVAEEAEARPDLAPLQVGEGETVLVVDDEPTVRILLGERLRELGYRTIEAEDGEAGLHLLQSEARIDLLVTDIGLPNGLDGRQVADGGRRVRPDLKVLFITGYDETAIGGGQDLPSGMSVLAKPFGMHALAQRVRELIAGPPLQQSDPG